MDKLSQTRYILVANVFFIYSIGCFEDMPAAFWFKLWQLLACTKS